MSGYASMHIEKIKSRSEMMKAYNHNYRIDTPLNADPEQIQENEELISLNNKTYLQVFDEKIDSLPYYYDHKIRKDAVMAFEIIMSLSRDDMDHVNVEDWKKDCANWLESTFNRNPDQFGDNVISAVYHGDETDCHIHAIVIPIDSRGHLCARGFGGSQRFREMQDSYGELMEQHYGLKRGQRYSVAKHEDVKRFYAHVNDAMAAELPPVEPGETAEAYKARNNEYFKDAMLTAYSTQLNGQKSAEEKATKYRADNIEKDKQIKELKTANQKLHREIDSLYLDLATARQETANLREGFEHEFGDLTEARKKVSSIDAINYGIQNHPDRDFAEGIREQMNQIILWATRELQKKQDKGKEIE